MHSGGPRARGAPTGAASAKGQTQGNREAGTPATGARWPGWPASPRFLPGDGARDRRTGLAGNACNQPFRLVSIPVAWTPSTRPFDRGTGAQRRYRKGDTIGGGLPHFRAGRSGVPSKWPGFAPILISKAISWSRVALVDRNSDNVPLYFFRTFYPSRLLLDAVLHCDREDGNLSSARRVPPSSRIGTGSTRSAMAAVGPTRLEQGRTVHP